MASPVRPGLDEPPPSPANFPGQEIPAVGGAPDFASQVTQAGFEIDKALTTLATMLPSGKGGDKLAQAKRLIQLAIADSLAESGENPAVLPGAAGMSFPSGGFGSSVP